MKRLTWLLLLAACGCTSDETSSGMMSDLGSPNDGGGMADQMEGTLPRVLITEAMLANESTLLDEAGEADDWFEILNVGREDIDLLGWGFTVTHGTAEAPFIVQENVILGSGQYLLLWADKDEAQGPLHTDFKLSKGDGEILTVLSPAGVVVDQLDIPANENSDESYARVGTADEWVVTTEPTPGAPNN